MDLFSDIDQSDQLSLRSRALNRVAINAFGADFVLCWLQQTLRGVNNPVIDAALLKANELKLPVVVYHGLGSAYPYASDRLHTFILQASKSLERDVEARGIRFMRHVVRPGNEHTDLVYRLAARAAAVYVDDVPTFVGSWQANSFAAKAEVTTIAVDGLRLIPEQALNIHARTTPEFRARAKSLRKAWLNPPADIKPEVDRYEDELEIESTSLTDPDGLRQIVAECPIDHSVTAIDWCDGYRDSALAQLSWALNSVVPDYATTRNNPSLEGVTKLSPYFHFGILTPHEVASEVLSLQMDSRSRWKFLDQLLIWREYFYHLASRNAHFHHYKNLPLNSLDSLSSHRRDPRPDLCTLAEIVNGETDDEVFNAAQKQFTIDGWMHNNLRMYWVKRLIALTKSPEDAWATACYLNDRFSLDGRDAATYGSIRWGFSTKSSQRDSPIYGTIPKKSDRGVRRKSGVNDWLELQSQRKVSADIYIPDSLPSIYTK